MLFAPTLLGAQDSKDIQVLVLLTLSCNMTKAAECEVKHLKKQHEIDYNDYAPNSLKYKLILIL